MGSFAILTIFHVLITLKYVNAVFPKWSSTYLMNSSTIIMACNYSGPFGQTALNHLSKFGIVDIDWSNNRELWANTAPMTCQQTLLSQAKIIKKMNPKTKVFVYRNLAKALPWFTDIRQKILDPNYADWWLKFTVKGPYHVPVCTNTTIGNNSDSKCSSFYHDQEHQTPEYPKICHKECDCGAGLPCGEYLYDHRNESVRKWLTDAFILDSINNTGLLNPNIDGFYIDDSWQYKNGYNSFGAGSAASACNNYNSFGGPTEIDPHCIQDMGLNSNDVESITNGWKQSMSMAHNAIIQNNGFEWKLFQPVKSPDSTSCTSWMKKTGSTLNDTALLYEYSKNGNQTQAEFEVDLAIFLLVRGDYAWLGYGWSGCHSNWIYQWNNMLDIDYGVPVDHTFIEVKTGVFQRKWTKYTIEMDCNKYKPSFTPI